MTRPRVLMVTGAYAPETSGASRQCRHLVRALHDRADFSILTTSTDALLLWQSTVDGVPVRRIVVNPQSRVSKVMAIERMASAMLELAAGVDIVHLHGFSQKSLLVIALAKLLGKRVVIKLTSVGHDDPAAIRARGRASLIAYRQADRFIGVSPRFVDDFAACGLDPDRFVFIPNGVDLERFRPAEIGERSRVQRELGIPDDDAVVLFVGFFSREKNPAVLFEAWAALMARGISSTLVLVGATKGAYYEIDVGIAEGIRAEAERRGLAGKVIFVEATDTIEKYYRAADIFALPTAREGLPNVLLEAMASGVPPVITLLEGVTDWIVTPGVTGELVPSVDAKSFSQALEGLLVSLSKRQQMAVAARAHVVANFGMAATADRTLDLYRDLLNGIHV